jgi:hypothetical protein
VFYFPLLSQLTSYVLFASRTRSCTHLRLVMHSLCHFLPKILQRGCLISSLALVVPYPLPFPPQNKATTPTCICWLQNREIYITGTAPYSTGTGYSTSTVRLQSWYCPTFFCRSIVFHFSVGLRYIRLMLHLLSFPVW